MSTTTIRVDRATHQELKRLARERHSTVAETVARAVRVLRQEQMAIDLAQRLDSARPSGSMLTSGDIIEVYLGAPQGSEAGLTRPVIAVTAQRHPRALPQCHPGRPAHSNDPRLRHRSHHHRRRPQRPRCPACSSPWHAPPRRPVPTTPWPELTHSHVRETPSCHSRCTAIRRSDRAGAARAAVTFPSRCTEWDFHC